MRRARPLLLAAAWLLLGADDPAPEAEPPESRGAESVPVDLDRLLRVPAAAGPQQERLGGRSRRAWYEEFERARGEIAALERSIEESQATLRSKASSGMVFTPAGASAATDPEALKLTAALRRDRQSLETAQQRLRDLEVEASLAGVPDDWRRSPE